MSHDKTTSTIGKLLDASAQRDAVHFAVAPTVAGDLLHPGSHVGLEADGRAVSSVRGSPPPIGIVDPFLKSPVKTGQRFWLFLYPQTVTGMRHEWTHPAFKNEAQESPHKAVSEQWLRKFGSSTGWDYMDLLDRLGTAIANGSVHAGDDDTADRFSANREELFRHYSIVTGRVITPEEIEAVYFSCAC